MAPITVDTGHRTEVWRFRCPNGHTSWEPTNGHFWCKECASHGWDVDPVFHELHDTQTNQQVGRDELTIVGPRAVG